MGLSVVFDLSDEDLDYFEKIFSERRAGGEDVALHDVVEATSQLIATAQTRGAPPFILGKLEELRPMIAMLTDDDWRLPQVKELHTIIDFDFYWPAMDQAVFPNAGTAWCHTSTTVWIGFKSAAYAIFFGEGMVGALFKDWDDQVLCVRAAY